MMLHAMRALRMGLHIFPVEPGEKTPHRVEPGKPYIIRWSEVATNDVNKVVEWWTHSPRANIGVACAPSNLLVVDCDLPKRPNALMGTPYEQLHDQYGEWLHGEDVLWELCRRYGGDWDELMDTYIVTTGSKGMHVYTRWPSGVQASQSSPVPEFVDVRGNGGEKGGYVLGAGSVTVKGPYTPDNDKPIRPTPQWLMELCRDRPREFARPVGIFSQPSGGSYTGLVDQIRYAPEGNRNNVLLWAARCMCSDGATQDVAEETLIPPANDNGISDQEARATIRSGYRLQKMKE